MSMEDSTDGRSLADLRQAERIRYFPGQLLTADDFAMEQDYWRGKGQLHNRLHLGQGVVCGLDVTPLTGTANGVRISPGLALDAWGREIVVPTVVELLPLRLSDDCDPVASGDEPLPRSVHVTICYREHAGRRREVAAEPDPEPTSQGGHGGICDASPSPADVVWPISPTGCARPKRRMLAGRPDRLFVVPRRGLNPTPSR